MLMQITTIMLKKKGSDSGHLYPRDLVKTLGGLQYQNAFVRKMFQSGERKKYEPPCMEEPTQHLWLHLRSTAYKLLSYVYKLLATHPSSQLCI